jgi:hypothetical protein
VIDLHNVGLTKVLLLFYALLTRFAAQSVRCIRVLNLNKSAHQPVLMIAEDNGNVIRRIEGDMVTRYAGTGQSGRKDGPRLEATFAFPVDIIKAKDGRYFISDYNHCLIRVIHHDGMVTTIGSGTDKCFDGSAKTASFDYPRGLCLSSRNSILVAEHMSHNIREIDEQLNVTTVLYPDKHPPRRTPAPGAPEQTARGPYEHSSKTLGPLGITAVPGTQDFIIVDNLNGTLRIWSIEDGSVEVLPVASKNPAYLTFTPNGDMWWTEHSSKGQADIFCVRKAIRPFNPEYEFENFKPFEKSFLTFIGEEESRNGIQLRQTTGLQNNIATLQHSGETLRLLRSVVNLTSPDLLLPEVLARVEASQVPLLSVKAWIQILHGVSLDLAVDSAEQLPAIAKQYAHMSFLSSLASMPCGRDWYHSKFVSTLRPITDIFALQSIYEDIVAVCASHEPLLEAISYRLKAQMSVSNSNSDTQNSSSSDHPTSSTPSTASKPSLTSPQKHLRYALRRLWKEMVAHPNDALPDSLPTRNFTISTSTGSDTTLVHDWLLYARWPYFKRMIDSGMSEATSQRLELPEGFPLQIFLQYLYNGKIDSIDFESAWYLRLNGGEFALKNLEDEAVPDFSRLLAECENLIWPVPSTRNAVSILQRYLEHCPSPSPSDPELSKTITVIGQFFSSIFSSKESVDSSKIPQEYLRAIEALKPTSADSSEAKEERAVR